MNRIRISEVGNVKRNDFISFNNNFNTNFNNNNILEDGEESLMLVKDFKEMDKLKEDKVSKEIKVNKDEDVVNDVIDNEKANQTTEQPITEEDNLYNRLRNTEIFQRTLISINMKK